MIVNPADVMQNPSDAKYYSMEPNPRSNVDTVNQQMIDKTTSRSYGSNSSQMDYLQRQAIAQQARDKYGSPKSPSMSKAMIDSVTNRPKSNTPMMDSMFKQKQGGAVKRKK
jgi:hypothetical protein